MVTENRLRAMPPSHPPPMLQGPGNRMEWTGRAELPRTALTWEQGQAAAPTVGYTGQASLCVGVLWTCGQS